MRTPARRPGIPACLAVAAAAALLVGCSDDDAADPTSAPEVSATAPAAAAGADDTSVLTPAATTIPLPLETSDLPPAPPASGDIPVFTPPETADVPVYLSVTVGVDDSAARVENVPFGASVTLDVVNPDSSDEYHLQGYELGAGEVMGPGQMYTFNFVANQLGDFVLESVTTGDVLLTLHVG